MGRIANDLQQSQIQSGSTYVRFNVAVNRMPNKQTGEKQSDFISCVAWNKTAELICNYFGKGRMIAIEGSIRTGQYDDKNGVKHYTTYLLVSNVSFTGEKSNNSGGGQQPSYSNQNGNYSQQQGYNGDFLGFEEVLNDDALPF